MLVTLSFAGCNRQSLGAIALVECSENPVMDPRDDEPPPRASVTEGTPFCGCMVYWPFFVLFDLWQSSKSAIGRCKRMNVQAYLGNGDLLW